MAFKLHVLRAFASPKIVNIHVTLVLSTGEEMTTPRESDFSAAFHGDRVIVFDGAAHHMHHGDLITSGHNQVKS
jgi:hypothetical protein